LLKYFYKFLYYSFLTIGIVLKYGGTTGGGADEKYGGTTGGGVAAKYGGTTGGVPLKYGGGVTGGVVKVGGVTGGVIGGTTGGVIGGVPLKYGGGTTGGVIGGVTGGVIGGGVIGGTTGGVIGGTTGGVIGGGVIGGTTGGVIGGGVTGGTTGGTTGGVTEVSLIVIVEEFATTVPVVETVLKLILNVSGPSVVKSAANDKTNDPESADIATDPPDVTALAGELKSALFTVPDSPVIVQYKVPVPKFLVATVNVTEEPSFTDVVLGVIVYEGIPI
jgi:hypothetical protein